MMTTGKNHHGVIHAARIIINNANMIKPGVNIVMFCF